MNSRPPPCEGDALPAELLPHMDATTRRSEVCMPFICRGQVFFVNRPSVVRERRACYPWHARDGQLRIRLRQAGGHACTSDRQDGDVVMSAARSGCFQAFSPWYADRQAPAFPECLRESMAAPKQAGTATPCPPGHTGASPGRVFRPATLTPRRTKPVASPGPLLPPSLKKIGRAAPVGLGYREKKRYRSPLVSL